MASVRCLLVLILVVVDNGLVLVQTRRLVSLLKVVLILVVVDNGLVHNNNFIETVSLEEVLILVVVDNGLVPQSLCLALSRSKRS